MTCGMKKCLLLILGFLSACPPFSSIQDPFTSQGSPAGGETAPAPSPLRILALDVGQGDATLVVGPTGRSLLIDGGPTGEGINTILPTLSSLGIDQLNWIVATHYDADHISGIPEVMKGPDQVIGTDDDVIPSSGLLDRGDFTDKTTPTYKEYLEIVTPYRREATPGQRLDLGDGSSAEVIVVNGRYADGSVIHLNPDEENEASIGLLVRYGDFSYFSAGDLPGGGSPGGYETKDMETIAGEIVGDIDVLHVSHHGGAASTKETFLDETDPESAIISVGRENDYGHPTEEVLTRLETAGAVVYRTDQMGTIEIQSDGNGYEITLP